MSVALLLDSFNLPSSYSISEPADPNWPALAEKLIETLNSSRKDTLVVQETLCDKLDEIEATQMMLSELQRKEASSEAEKQKLSKENSELHEKIGRLSREASAFESKLHATDVEKKQLLSAFELRQEEIDEKQETISRLSSRMQSYKSESAAKEAENEKLHADLISMQMKLSMIEQENAKIRAQQTWIEADYQENVSAFANYRKAKSAELVEAHGKLDELAKEWNVLRNSAAQAESNYEGLQKRHDAVLAQLKQAVDQNTEIESNYKQELNSNLKVIGLYKATCDELETRIGSLETANCELVNTCNSMQIQFNEKLSSFENEKADLEKLNEEKSSILDQMKARIDDLSKESTLSILSPTAAAHGSKAKKSSTQIYSDLAVAQNDLLKEKRESARLRDCLQEIIKDVEERSVAVRTRQEEFEKMEADVSILNSRLQEQLQTSENLSNELGALRKVNAQLLRANEELEQRKKDLGRQVQYLLKELGDPKSTYDEYSHSQDVQTSQDLITTQLLEFKNIEELQQRNEELVRVVRGLSEQLETFESMSESAKLNSAQMETLMNEMNELREGRERQAQMVEALVKQRDILKETIKQMQSQSTPPTPTRLESRTPKTPTPQIELQLSAEKSALAKDLQAELDSKIKEIADIKVELSKTRTQNDFLSSRIEMIQKSSESSRADLENARLRLSEYSTSLVEHQKRMQQLTDDLTMSRESEKKTLAALSASNGELSVAKALSERSTAEIVRMQQEVDRSQNLLKKLQIMQTEFDKSDEQSRKRLSQETERLERELQAVRGRYTEEQSHWKNKESLLTFEKQEMQEKLDAQASSLTSTRETNISLKCKFEESERRIASLESQLLSSESRINLMISQASKGRDQNIVVKELEASKQTIRDLQEELATAREQSEKFREISLTNEESLNQVSASFQQFKETVEKILAEKSSKLELSEKEFSALQLEHDGVLSELNQTKSTLSEKTSLFEREILSSRQEIERLKTIESQFNQNQYVVSSDLNTVQSKCSELKAQFENEVVAHAADIKECSRLRGLVEALKLEISNLKIELSAASAQVERLTGSSKVEIQSLVAKLEQSRSQMADLEKHNMILHNQFEVLTTQTIRQRESREESLSSDSLDELGQVVKYLRREKEILQCESESLGHENRRLKQQLEHVQVALDKAKTSSADKDIKAAHDRLLSDYQNLLDKVSQVNILRESNVTLREENESSLQRIRELETVLLQNQQDVEPLRLKIASLGREIESTNTELAAARQQATAWKEKAQSILEKYNQIDPEEHESVKRERDSLLASSKAAAEAGSKEELEARDQKIADLDARIKKLATVCQQWKNKAELLAKQVKEMEAKEKETEGAKEQDSLLSVELQNCRTQIESDTLTINKQKERIGLLSKELDECRLKQEECARLLESVRAENEGLVAEKSETADEAVTRLEKELSEKVQRLEKFTVAVQKLTLIKEEYVKLRKQFEAKEADNKALSARLEEASKKIEDQKRDQESKVSVLQTKLSKLQEEEKKRSLEEEPDADQEDKKTKTAKPDVAVTKKLRRLSSKLKKKQ